VSLQLRQRPVRFSRRGHLHQRFAVQHDLIRDLADASQSRTMAVGDELGDPDRDIADRFTEIERLRDVDGARTRQTRAGGSSLPTSTNRLHAIPRPARSNFPHIGNQLLPSYGAEPQVGVVVSPSTAASEAAGGAGNALVVVWAAIFAFCPFMNSR